VLTMRNSILRLLVILLTGYSTACHLGPEPIRPVNPAETAEAYIHDPHPDSGKAPAVSRWWERFHQPELNRLVEEALENNIDLQTSGAKVAEALATLESVRGSLWPQAQMDGSGSRQKTSFVLPSIGRTSVYSTTYSLDLSVSYQVDLFGRLSRTRQAAQADFLAVEADREALIHTVVASTVRAWVQTAALQNQLELARRDLQSWSDSVQSMELRYANGLLSSLDLRRARENLASAKVRVEELTRSVKLSLHAIDVLTGKKPGTGFVQPASLETMPIPELVPPGLPGDLLDRRPDLRGSEFRAMAATARVGASMANLFPSLSLTGAVGTRSDTLKNLTSSDGLIYSAILGIVTPLFKGGQLRAEVRASRARMDAAASTYAGRVLTALREVEDALVRESSARTILQESGIRVREAKAAETLTRDRYNGGISPYLTFLDAGRQARSAENQYLLALNELWTARVDLYLALGGDWETSAEMNDEPLPTTPGGSHD